MKWTIEQTSSYTLDNYITRYNLVCADKLKISSVGMFFFLGMFIGNFFIPSMIDRFGRKKFFHWGMLLNLLTNLVLLCLPVGNEFFFYVTIVVFMAKGVGNAIRIPSGVGYLYEFVPERYASFCSTFWSA
jgi:MFS family permease